MEKHNPELAKSLRGLRSINRTMVTSFEDLVDIQDKVDYKAWQFNKMHSFIFIKKRLRSEVRVTR